MLEQGKKANLPADQDLLVYDEAADSDEVHKLLRRRDHATDPDGSLREDPPERMPPGHDGTSNVVYTEDGSIWLR